MRIKFFVPLIFISSILNSQDYFTNRLFVKLKEDYKSSYALDKDAKLRVLLYPIETVSVKPVSIHPLLNSTFELILDKDANLDSLILRLNQFPEIDFAEKVPLYKLFFTPNDPLYSSQWNLSKIQADLALNLNQGCTNVKIAVTDDGFLMTHEDLVNQWHINSGEIAGNGLDDDANGYIDDWRGWDAANNDNDPSATTPTNSYFTHGTHVAGIIAGQTHNSKGIAAIGYNCKMIPIKLGLSSNSSLTGAFQGLDYAVNASGCDVINMSWGGGGWSATYQALFNIAKTKGILCVAASGNSNTSTPMYPASYNHVISVAASSSTDARASFSNYGSTIDVTAPGVDIPSCLAGATNSYGNLSGTSMASPLVAGLCALMKCYNPIPADSIEACLKRTCDNINAQNPSFIGQLGAGRINAFQALHCLTKKPKSDFIALDTFQCIGKSVRYAARSFGIPSLTYNWSFPGGSPTSSTLANPLVTYSSNGYKSATLITCNSLGCDTITKTNLVNIDTPKASLIGRKYTSYNSNPVLITIKFTGNPPYSVTLTDGTNTWSQSNIKANPYFLSIVPKKDTSLISISTYSDSLCLGNRYSVDTLYKIKMEVTTVELNCLRVKSHQLITENMGGFSHSLPANGFYGFGCSNVGDWDNDGVNDIMVGAILENSNSGRIYFLRMNSNGTVKNSSIIDNTTLMVFGGINQHVSSQFGTSIRVVGDINGDGIKDIIVTGANDNSQAGAVFVMFMTAAGSVSSVVKWKDGQNGIASATLPSMSRFGWNVNPIGDWDSDGIPDAVIGAGNFDDGGPNKGAIFICLINSNGTVKQIIKNSPTSNTILNGILNNEDRFGLPIFLGDINSDGLKDFAVGTCMRSFLGVQTGAIFIVSMNASGVITKVLNTIGPNTGGFNYPLNNQDFFGYSMVDIGDYNKDGVKDLIVGAIGDDDGGSNRGAFWILFLNTDGSVKKSVKVSQTFGNFKGNLSNGASFGFNLTNIGDYDNNGYEDFAVGSFEQMVNGVPKGAVWILFMEDTCNQNPPCDTSRRYTYIQCLNDSIQVLLRAGSRYQWSPSIGLSSDTLRNPKIYLSANRTYLVSYLNTKGCKLIDTIEILVKQAVIYPKMEDQLICISDSLQMTIPIYGTNIVWSPNLSISSTTAKTPFFFPTTNRTYYLEFRDSLGCLQRDTFVINTKVCCPVRAQFTIPKEILCYGENLTVTNTSKGPITSYNWNFGAANPNTFTGANPPILTFPSGGSYTLRLIVTNASCFDTMIKIVNVVHIIPYAGKDTTNCLGAFVTDLGESPISDWTCKWTPTMYLDDPNLANPTCNIVNDSINYVLEITDRSSGCKARDTVIVYTNRNIDSNVTRLRICSGDSVFFNSSYIKTTSRYFYTIKKADRICDSFIDILDLNVLQKQFINEPTPKSYCEFNIDSKGKRHDTSYIERDTIRSKSLPNCDSIVIVRDVFIYKRVFRERRPAESGCAPFRYKGKTYLVSKMKADSIRIRNINLLNCDTIEYINIIVYPKPKAEITPSIPNPVMYKQTVTLTASGGQTYLWLQTGSTNSEIDYKIHNTQPKLYTVRVTDENDCWDTTSYIIKGELPDTCFYGFPNVFSPNQDNLNDEYIPNMDECTEIKVFAIYDRWGEKVFETNQHKGWNGTYKGRPAPSDIYLYYAEMNTPWGVQTRKGTFTLMR